jgi:hypothetical protein
MRYILRDVNGQDLTVNPTGYEPMIGRTEGV